MPSSDKQISKLPLCNIIQRKSIWIWNTLRSARQNQSKIGEESITDFFVLALKAASNGAYYIESFTRPREKISGADWELWLSGPSGKWLGLRVQAKVISLDGQKYSQLHYKRKDNSLQIDQLIADAKKHNAIPLYCLYSYWQRHEANRIDWPCQSLNKNSKLFGASTLSAYTVKKLAPNDKSLTSVSKNLSPLHCIFCCHGYQSGDLPARAYGFLRERGYVPDGLVLLPNPPDYVKQIMEMEKEPYGDLDIADENLSRITVIRETQK
jgi:hypothetical protein